MLGCTRLNQWRTVQPLSIASLLRGLEFEVAKGDSDTLVSGVAFRSDDVRVGDVFFCIPGFKHDGHDFAADAVGRGAVALVVKRPLGGFEGVAQVVVPDPRIALSRASAMLLGCPSARLSVVGVTGTNGKTTTTYLIESVLRAAGHTTGLIGTVETRIADRKAPAGRTTPESLDLQRLFAEMLDEGVTAAAMEVSSHAIDLKRVEDVEFACAAFTNLSQDHLDYHRSMEEYFAVKRRLFSSLSKGPAVVNVDDPAGATLAVDSKAEWTVGFAEGAKLRAVDVELEPRQTRFRLVESGSAIDVRIPLAGNFNVSNALVAAGCGRALGIDLATVARGLEAAEQVPGRLERIDCESGFAVFVDYAHTPAGLEQAIGAVRAVTKGRVITVFGCGGDRDPEKRPLMGAAASELSDVVVVTTDNPRTEDPVGIILQIEDGMRAFETRYEVEVDRRRAIERAIEEAAPGDTVLIAGKGHEDYQIFADRTVHFDDREVAREALGC